MKIYQSLSLRTLAVFSLSMCNGSHRPAEAKGKQSDYIRFGMDYDKWLSNCNKLLTETNVDLNIMVTFMQEYLVDLF